MAGELLQIVNGMRMGRPYNDYTDMPASKIGQPSSPRVRVNGLLNAAIISGQAVTWWWKSTDTIASAGSVRPSSSTVAATVEQSSADRAPAGQLTATGGGKTRLR